MLNIAKKKLSNGVAHKMPNDLRDKILKTKGAADAWESITLLGRNEFLCWVEEAKKPETRLVRVNRTAKEIAEGKRRPCCWAGCPHRKR